MTIPKNNTKEIRYSEILRRFVHPIIEENDDLGNIEKKYAFGMHVWNAAILQEKHPDLFEQAREQVVKKAENATEAEALFDEMVAFQQKEFKMYQRVFIDFEILQQVDKGYSVTAATAELKK